MESTGVRDKIQISQETAELLYAAGKSRWVTPREDKVVAKGKGEVGWIIAPILSLSTCPNISHHYLFGVFVAANLLVGLHTFVRWYRIYWFDIRRE